MSGLALLGCVRASGSMAEPDARPASGIDATRPLVASSRGWLEERECALSCHTTHTFLLASEHLGPDASAVRTAILDRVDARVQGWASAEPWYGGTPQKVAQSRGTEAVLNAFGLTTQDHPAASKAIDHLALAQRDDGGWDWLDFGLSPWEDADAEVAGAALAAVALAQAPDPPAATVSALRTYLRRHADDDPSLHNAVALLWSDATLGEILRGGPGDPTLRAVLDAQDSDGSWSRDAYLTAFAVYALAQCSGDAPTAAAARGRTWLRKHQAASGAWRAHSPNRRRAFNHQLATDAATALAVLALHPRE